MVRLDQMPTAVRSRLLGIECPTFDTRPWVEGPPLKDRRLAIISTAGLHCRGDRPFELGSDDYRLIPGDIQANELIMSHVSANFDRTGFEQDLNVIFPVDRLRELAEQRVIQSLAGYHYSFMGATDPRKMEPTARHLATLLKNDQVNAVLLIPV